MAEGRKSRMALQGWVSMGFVILGVLIAPVRMSILTRSLTKEDYGLFSLLSITVAALGFIGVLGLRQFLIYILPGKNEQEQGRYFNSCLLATALFSTMLGFVFLGAGHTVPLLSNSFSATLILLGALFIPLYSLTNLGIGYLLATGEVIRSRFLNFLTSSLWLCLAIPVFLFWSKSINVLACLWVSGLFITLIVMAYWSRQRLGDGIHAHPETGLMKEGIRYGIPLLPRYFAAALFRMADRFVILDEMGAEQVALYSVAATLVFFAAETYVFLEFMLPHISREWNKNVTDGKPGCSGTASEHFHTALRLTLLTTVPLAVGLLLWGSAVVQLLASASYAGSHVVFPIMAPVVPIIASTGLMQFGISLTGRTKVIGYSILAASLLNLGLNIVLVKLMGISGAAAATTFSYALLFIFTVLTSGLIPYMRLRALRLPSLIISAIVMFVATLIIRRLIGHFTLLELPLGGIAFLAAGFVSRLWTMDELKSILPRSWHK